MLCEDPGQAAPARLALPAARAALVAVGPEGGWSAEGVAAGVRSGVRPIHLGPRIRARRRQESSPWPC